MMTPYSGMSLHDELSQSNSSLHMLRLTPDDLSSPELDDSDQITMDHIVRFTLLRLSSNVILYK